MFQSTPDITAGRHVITFDVGGTFSKFQSTPDITAGRHAAVKFTIVQAKGFQSTPDITAGRHTYPVRTCQLVDCFNPRPTSLPGDTVGV